MQTPPGPKNPDLRLDQVLKIFTTVPPKFIDDFYALYDRNNVFKKDCTIDLNILATWLEVEKFQLIKTLTNSYTLKVDYIVVDKNVKTTTKKSKYGGNNFKNVMITPDCMKRLCMRSRAAKAETVRTYFIKIEEFISTYKTEIVDGLMRNIHEDARRNRAEHRKDGPGNVYVLRAADDPREFLDKVELNKLGQTKMSMDDRLRVYNTGRAKDAEMLTVYKVPFRKEVETCVKKLIRKKRYIKRREIYEVDNEIITKLIEGCNEMSMKLQYVTRKSKLTGPYYIIFTSELDDLSK